MEQGFYNIGLFESILKCRVDEIFNDRFRLDRIVHEVEFKLHESYPNPVRTIRTADSSGAYRITESGYASFIVSIKVKFVNGLCKDLKV